MSKKLIVLSLIGMFLLAVVVFITTTPTITSASLQRQTSTPTLENPIILQGKLVHQTDEEAKFKEIPIEIQLVRLTPDDEIIQLFETEVTTNSEGEFEVSVLKEPGTMAFEFDYDGARQRALKSFFWQDDTNVVDLYIPVYDITYDPENIVIETASIYFDGVSAEGASLIYQYMDVANRGEEAYVDEDGYSIVIPLPEVAQRASMQARMSTHYELVLVEEDDDYTFRDTHPLPGDYTLYNVSVSYGTQYLGDIAIEHVFPYPVETLTVYLFESRHLELTSEQLKYDHIAELSNGNYVGYTLTEPLEAGETLTYTIEDTPQTP